MIKNISSKWLLALLGTIVLGAIGSGVWDVVFKPCFSWVAEILLNVATLGLAAIRDSMYVEIAKGTYERAGLFILALSSGFLGGVFVTYALAILVIVRLSSDRLKWYRSAIIGSKNIILGLGLFSGLIAGFLLINCVRMIYIIRAANHIEQLQHIVAPFIDAERRLSITSHVAQISSRNDYERIIIELNSIAERQNIRVPTFNVY